MSQNKCIVFLFLMMFVSCDYSDDRLTVKNDLNDKISVAFKFNREDSLVNSLSIQLKDSINKRSNKKFTMPSGKSKNAWSQRINASKDKKLYVYIFSLDTLKTYKNMATINQLVKWNKFERFLNFSIEDLDRLNWIIEVK